MLGSLIESKTDTGEQATSALSRLLYDTNHVNYSKTTDEYIRETESVTRADLVAFKSHVGRGGLVAAVTGDIEPHKALAIIEKTFSKLSEGTTEQLPKARNTKKPQASEKLITISDKANVDMYIGAAVPLTYTDPLYYSFTTAVDMLGGSFASHLMQTIRERDGLTYGIRSSAGGFGGGADGYFRVSATFSPDLYEKGVAATRKEIDLFFKKHLTSDVLEKKQDELTGSYLIGLSTTYGLAKRLHGIGVRKEPLTEIDEYPHIIREITVNDIQDAAALIPLDKLSLAAAGSFQSPNKLAGKDKA